MSYIKYLLLACFLCACNPPPRGGSVEANKAKYIVVCDQPGSDEPRTLKATSFHTDDAMIKVYLLNGDVEYFINTPCRVLYRR